MAKIKAGNWVVDNEDEHRPRRCMKVLEVLTGRRGPLLLLEGDHYDGPVEAANFMKVGKPVTRVDAPRTFSPNLAALESVLGQLGLAKQDVRESRGGNKELAREAFHEYLNEQVVPAMNAVIADMVVDQAVAKLARLVLQLGRWDWDHPKPSRE